MGIECCVFVLRPNIYINYITTYTFYFQVQYLTIITETKFFFNNLKQRNNSMKKIKT
jgi:hypothetical protein